MVESCVTNEQRYSRLDRIFGALPNVIVLEAPSCSFEVRLLLARDPLVQRSYCGCCQRLVCVVDGFHVRRPVGLEFFFARLASS